MSDGPVEQLLAQAVVIQGEGWCQGTFSQGTTMDGTIQRCLVGSLRSATAMLRALHDKRLSSKHYLKVFEAARPYVLAVLEDRYPDGVHVYGFSQIEGYNDECVESLEDAVAVLEKARAKAAEDGA